MKRARKRARVLMAEASLLLAFASSRGGDAPPAATEPAVQLPPMLVEEATSGVQWLYVNVGGTEFLSRCTAGTTRSLVEAWLTQMQLVHALVPEECLARMDVPSVFVLYAQDLQQTVSAEIQRELKKEDTSAGVDIATSMRLSDRDMHASIAYIDETLFDAANLTISSGHVRYLLRGRVPELPAWAIDGFERAIRGADFLQRPITLRPMIWGSQNESDALGGDGERPRALLSAGELFAPDGVRATESQHPRHIETRALTQELFVRWALDSSVATRTAFWKFVTRAAEVPVTEELFESFFGFDFAELRDRLSDYAPKAVSHEIYLDAGRLPPVPDFEVEPATPDQIARVRGEWERLAIGHVQRRLPRVREPYIAQARRTLHRAYDAGDRDPRLLATMGLCEVDSGNDAGARTFLEPAVRAGVVRPRAYYELARLRFAEVRADAPETKLFSVVQITPVILPLHRMLEQSPPLPESFGLLAEAWARCEASPSTEEFHDLELGARLFPHRPAVAVPTARAFLRHGRKSEAAALLAACADYASDDRTREEIRQLRAELNRAR